MVVTQNVLDQREEEKWRTQLEEQAQQRAQMEALARLQEEQRARLRREEAERIRDEKLAKMAPWANSASSDDDRRVKVGLTPSPPLSVPGMGLGGRVPLV